MEVTITLLEESVPEPGTGTALEPIFERKFLEA
jgi:hypothetical protein